ncbi:MAG TPA: hypothetical protein VGX76_21830 [Pirellulales bacterium]|jgi:hypothetical protein|nr:hypothetical protein [Pirellulales bacterium]
MSWAFYAQGKPRPVVAKAADAFAKMTYVTGVEGELKDAVAAIVRDAVSAFSDDAAVKVECSGHAVTGDQAGQQLQISICPIAGFLNDT